MWMRITDSCHLSFNRFSFQVCESRRVTKSFREWVTVDLQFCDLRIERDERQEEEMSRRGKEMTRESAFVL